MTDPGVFFFIGGLITGFSGAILLLVMLVAVRPSGHGE